MSNLLHCDIGEVVQYLKEQNKVFFAIRLSDCLKDSNESLVKLTIENQKLRNERDKARRLYLASTCSEDEIIHEMKRHGWDCFKEDGKPCQ
jgi:hypothetical protein